MKINPSNVSWPIQEIDGERFGTIFCKKYDDQRMEILRADPKILLGAEFIYAPHKFDVRYVEQSTNWPEPGTIITFMDDFNHKYIYRLRELKYMYLLWVAEWPD